ncbi:hypothetical protein IE00_17315 [Paracoccus sp. SM22M-07]|nr:hypothetical protein IE00_17315 [Paracoccus sp. SM22M-07]
MKKLHSFYCNRCTVPLCDAASHITCSKIHLRHQPTSKYIPGWIRVGWHGDGTDNQNPFLLLAAM